MPTTPGLRGQEQYRTAFRIAGVLIFGLGLLQGLLGVGRTVDDEASKSCASCGRPASLDARFCESCGHAFS